MEGHRSCLCLAFIMLFMILRYNSFFFFLGFILFPPCITFPDMQRLSVLSFGCRGRSAVLGGTYSRAGRLFLSRRSCRCPAAHGGISLRYGHRHRIRCSDARPFRVLLRSVPRASARVIGRALSFSALHPPQAQATFQPFCLYHEHFRVCHFRPPFRFDRRVSLTKGAIRFAGAMTADAPISASFAATFPAAAWLFGSGDV